MKELAFIGFGLCVVCMLSSCKSSESAYKKAYEFFKDQRREDGLMIFECGSCDPPGSG